MSKDNNNDKVLLFQDFNLTTNSNDDEDVSLVFFELANAPYVGYEIINNNDCSCSDDKDKDGDDDSDDDDDDSDRDSAPTPATTTTATTASTTTIVIKQDVNACGEHTGGIVWETSYLLLQYLHLQQEQGKNINKSYSLGNTLELGAGCGMLGQVLFALGLCSKMILTETQPVMKNLLSNVERNKKKMIKMIRRKMKQQKKKKTNNNDSDDIQLETHTLDWNNYEIDCKNAGIVPHSQDTIIGTDVVFTPNLVEPLLQTIQYLSHENTIIYLCLQERCKDSHQLLLSKATSSQHGFVLENITNTVTSIPSCQWGATMECQVLKLTKVINNEKTKKKKKKIDDTTKDPAYPSSKNTTRYSPSSSDDKKKKKKKKKQRIV